MANFKAVVTYTFPGEDIPPELQTAISKELKQTLQNVLDKHQQPAVSTTASSALRSGVETTAKVVKADCCQKGTV